MKKIQAIRDRKYSTFFGIPKLLSKLAKMKPNIKAENKAPRLSVKRSF